MTAMLGELSLAFLVLAFILVWKGLKEPNRR